MIHSDSAFSVKDANGRHISLLNTQNIPATTTYTDSSPTNPMRQRALSGRRKYHCNEPGCKKSFTTSGHLARHNRIHTGEKNFQCLYPGCPSRFSRQDNMMQHYRTHLSPRSRRNHQLVRKTNPSFAHYPPYEIDRRIPILTFDGLSSVSSTHTSPLSSPTEELHSPILPQLQSPSFADKAVMKLQPLEPSPPSLFTTSPPSSFLCATPPLSPSARPILLPPVRPMMYHPSEPVAAAVQHFRVISTPS
ncbi:hypothetical protein BX666DRAFT_2112129 [Dichotomocladium elegans]|nr:hypothetical protein BX666DRAFT_2112129 [Dichotomocladium elegans]